MCGNTEQTLCHHNLKFEEENQFELIFMKNFKKRMNQRIFSLNLESDLKKFWIFTPRLVYSVKNRFKHDSFNISHFLEVHNGFSRGILMRAPIIHLLFQCLLVTLTQMSGSPYFLRNTSPNSMFVLEPAHIALFLPTTCRFHHSSSNFAFFGAFSVRKSFNGPSLVSYIS